MTPSATLRWFGITTFVLAASGSATAQTTAPPPPAPSGPPIGQISFDNTTNLSMSEMVSVANAIVTKMNGASKQVRNQLATARGARDVVKTLCLNDKLSQIDVTTRAAESRLSNIQAAVANGNKESAHHEMNMLSALGQRSDQSTAEANQCVGEELAFVGATQVSTSVDGDIITVDEYVDVNTGVIVVVPVPPSAASPSK